MRLTRCLAAAALVGMLTGATASTSAPPKGLIDPIPAPLREGTIQVGLRTIAGGMVAPVAGTFAPGIADRCRICRSHKPPRHP